MLLNAHADLGWPFISDYRPMVEFFLAHGNDLYAPYPMGACVGVGQRKNQASRFRTVHHVAYNLGLEVVLCERDQEWDRLSPF